MMLGYSYGYAMKVSLKLSQTWNIYMYSLFLKSWMYGLELTNVRIGNCIQEVTYECGKYHLLSLPSVIVYTQAQHSQMWLLHKFYNVFWNGDIDRCLVMEHH